jgi:spermidine synthase
MQTKKKKEQNWFVDQDSENRWISHRIKKRIVKAKTKFQKIGIFDSYALGKIAVLDGKIQSAEKDEFIYHEALVHPAMIIHPHPSNILILGGGEGATLREVLKYPSVRHVKMIDIDKEFVKFCKKYLKKWHQNSFKDKRVELIHDDAFSYMQTVKGKYDVIIADISDPVENGPANLIYTEKFYFLIQQSLKNNGIFVTHATAIDFTVHTNISKKIFKMLNKIFPLANIYYDYVPSFGTLWSFILCSFKENPLKISPVVVDARLSRRKIKVSYYDSHAHKRLFSIPKHVRKLLKN